MKVAEAPDIINPRELDAGELEWELARLARGAQTEHEVEERIRQRFLPKPQVWVQRRGDQDWGILIQLGPGEDNRSFIVPMDLK